MIENHVCSLELAKKIKELGIKQESVFYWAKQGIFVPGISNPETDTHAITIPSSKQYIQKLREPYSAFLASELGEFMSKISVLDKGYQQFIELSIHGCGFLPEDNDFSKNIIFVDDSEPNMRAKMLIYLIEEGYVKVEDINQ